MKTIHAVIAALAFAAALDAGAQVTRTQPPLDRTASATETSGAMILFGDLVLADGATLDVSEQNFVSRAGPQVGFVRIRIAGQDVVLPVFWPMRQPDAQR